MARYLVIGDPVVTLAEQAFIPDGALIVDGRTITEVGPREELETKGSFDRVIGSTDHFVMPGFINCHFHSEAAMGYGIWEWLFERTNIYAHLSFFANVSEEDQYNGVMVMLMQALRGGITCTVDSYYGRPSLTNYGMDIALQAYEDLGLRTGFGITLRDDNLYVHEPDEQFLSRLPSDLAREVRESPMGYAHPVDDVLGAYEDVVNRWDRRDNRIRVLLAPDWTPAVSDDLYRRCRQVADDYETGIMSHVLETRSEMQYNIKRYGVTAMERLARTGVLGPDMSLSHFVWATDRDLEILADTGAVASCNPGSNLRLSTGICRVRDIIDIGGRVAFGTDGISFSERDDIFQEIRLAAYLQRLPKGPEPEHGRMDSETLLRAAVANGARAARAGDRIGAVAPGKDADLLILRRDRVFWPPARYKNTPALDVIMDRTDATDIESVIVAGRVLIDEGKITTVNEQRIKDSFAESFDRMFEIGPEFQRLAELPVEIEPYLFAFYRPWAEEAVVPGYEYNTKTGPVGFTGGIRRNEVVTNASSV